MKKFIDKLMFFIATGCYTGLFSKAPGTIGSLLCVCLWTVATRHFNISPILFCIIIYLLAVISTPYCLKELQKQKPNDKDPQVIVIDEWIGIIVPLYITCFFENPLWIFVAFILFRIFDISKWWLVGKAESFPGALGVIADDLVAGTFAALSMLIFLFLEQAIHLF